MPKALYSPGSKHASSLVRAGKVKESSSWNAPSADKENEYIDKHGLSAFAKWHLGYDSGQAEENKGRYSFPFSSDYETVDVAGLRAIITRAAQAGYDAIKSKAQKLLDEAKKKLGKDDSRNFSKVTPFRNGRITVQFNQLEEQEPVTIQIYEDIGDDPFAENCGFTAKDFSDALQDIPRNRPIDLRINSAGGNVWDGFAIKTLLDEWPARKTASIDGMAASVASWLPMSVDEIRAPRHAQMFIHPAWGITMGNAQDHIKAAQDLERTTGQIADIYARKTGMPSADCRSLMEANTLLTAEEAYDYGFIDRLTDDRPVANFTETQFNNMKAKLALMLNSVGKSLPTKPAGDKPSKPTNRTDMTKAQMIALLNKWGISNLKDADEKHLAFLIDQGKAWCLKNLKNYDADKVTKMMADHDADGDDDDDDDGEPKNAPDVDPASGADPDHEPPGKKKEGELWKEAAANNRRMEQMLNRIEKRELEAKRTVVSNRIKAAVEADKIPAGQMDAWIEDALQAKDTDKFLNRLDELEARPPGVRPLSVAVGESSSVEELNKAVENLMAPQNHLMRNRSRGDYDTRRVIGLNCKQLSQIINSLKKFDSEGNLTGPLRQMWDAWAAQSSASPRNANTMSSGLLRQVILSEVMRAFRRRLIALSFFAHTFQNVPLEGTDVIQVPYYPLDTVASQDFVQANGYQITPNAQTLSKSITVGGIGGAKSPGIGRKYKGLQFSAYEIRRQPWLDIQKLTVMAGEQLALDVLNDIITAWINQANFGNAVFSGPAAAFSADVVSTQLQVAANRADWPEPMRNLVLDTAYYASLLADPYVKAFLNIGSTEPVREAKVGGLYGFENTVQNPRIPQTGDANLIGWMSWPSSILVATAPIMPAPGEMLRLVTAETVVDDQTGLSFTYKYWGDPMFSTDYEIIECTYGSGLGELAALKRLVSAGV